MPEENLQANLILAGDPGDIDRPSLPLRGLNDAAVGTGLTGSGADTRCSGVLAVLEKERARIGRELHSGAGQPLAGITQNLEMLAEYAGAMPPEARAILWRLDRLAAQATEQVRSASHALYPPDWQRLSLTEALRRLVAAGVPEGRYQVSFACDPLPVEPSHFVKITLYRCAQECIANVLRHAGAAHFALTVKALESDVELEVSDDGLGFSASRGAGNGIGIASLYDYTGMAGGSCRIISDPEGTRVIIKVPLAQE